MNILKDVITLIKLWDKTVIGTTSLGTCTVFKLLSERISPHGNGFLASMSQDGI